MDRDPDEMPAVTPRPRSRIKLVRRLLFGYVLFMLLAIVVGGIYNLSTKQATPESAQDKPPYAMTPAPGK